MKRTVFVYHFHNSNANSGLGAWPEGYELLNQLRGYPSSAGPARKEAQAW